MWHRSFPLLACLLALLAGGPAHAASPPDLIQNQYLVLLSDAEPDTERAAADLATRHGLARGHTYRHALKGFAAHVPPSRLAALAADPRVTMLAPDRLLTLETSVVPGGQGLPTGVDRIEADHSRAAAGDGRGAVDVDVAVIDTGIDPTHPDLNVVGGYNCTSKKRDAWADNAGHGTHVAGIIGARDDAAGVVGVAPGARLWAVKVGDAKKAKTSDVVCGLDWVAQHAATIRVANMSLGGAGADDGRCGLLNKDALHAAVCRATAAGVTVVVSAGNSAADLAGQVPASYDEVLTVTAMADFDGRPGGLAQVCRAGESDDMPASFSSYAVDPRDNAHTIAAPGVCITTTYPMVGGGFVTASGTSAAAPHATGAVALCVASGRCARMAPTAIVAHLRETATAQPAGFGFVDRTASGRYGPVLYAGAY